MPGVSAGTGAGLPFHVCSGLGMLHASRAVSSVIVVSEKEEETTHPTCKQHQHQMEWELVEKQTLN